MFGLDDLLDFGASLYSADSSRAGQESANATNMAIAEMNNRTMVELANTAHQREVKDLIAAGLNPVLSVDGAGAPVPALTSAKVENAQKNNIGSAIHEGFSAKSQRDAVEQQKELNEANIKVADAQAKNLDVQNQKLKAEIDETKAKTYKTFSDADMPGSVGTVGRNLKTFFGSREAPVSRYQRQLDVSSKVHDLGVSTIKAHRSHSAKDLPFIDSLFK